MCVDLKTQEGGKKNSANQQHDNGTNKEKKVIPRHTKEKKTGESLWIIPDMFI